MSTSRPGNRGARASPARSRRAVAARRARPRETRGHERSSKEAEDAPDTKTQFEHRFHDLMAANPDIPRPAYHVTWKALTQTPKRSRAGSGPFLQRLPVAPAHAH